MCFNVWNEHQNKWGHNSWSYLSVAVHRIIHVENLFNIFWPGRGVILNPTPSHTKSMTAVQPLPIMTCLLVNLVKKDQTIRCRVMQHFVDTCRAKKKRTKIDILHTFVNNILLFLNCSMTLPIVSYISPTFWSVI